MMKNVTKVLSGIYHKYVGRFHMLSVNVCSETVLLRERSNQDFHTLSFRKYISSDNNPFIKNV